MLDALPDTTKQPPKSASLRLVEALSDLRSGDQKRAQSAISELQDKLAPATRQLMDDATRQRVSGKSSDSSTIDLAKDQVDLLRLARAGDKAAERMLIWTEAMKPVAELRNAVEKAAVPMELKKDHKGRPCEIEKDGIKTKLSYNGDSREPASVEILDKQGTCLAREEGRIRVDTRTGDVTVVTQDDKALSLARVETTFGAGGKVQKVEFSESGLRTKQTESEIKTDEKDIKTIAVKSCTNYDYYGAGPDGRRTITDNPLAVRLSVATTRDVHGRVIDTSNFTSFAAVEVGRPSISESIERTERQAGRETETHIIVNSSNPDGPQPIGEIKRTVDHNTGERVYTEKSTLNDLEINQSVTFDVNGIPTAFTRKTGNDSYSYQLREGKIVSVTKNGDELLGNELEQSKKEGNRILSAVALSGGIRSYKDEIVQPLLDPQSSAESRRQALADLEALKQRSNPPAGDNLGAEIDRLKAHDQSRRLTEQAGKADRAGIKENVSEKGRELIASDSNGNESFTVRLRPDGKPNLVHEKGGFHWSSDDGGKTWHGYIDKDLKEVEIVK